MATALIHPTAEVPDGCEVGVGTRVWHQSQLMPGVRVGAECTLGKGVFLGTGTTVGDFVKIGNYACVFGASVAHRAFIGPHACLLEDPSPRATAPDGRRKDPGDWQPRPVWVGEGATIGAGALVLPGVRIGANAMIAAGAVVQRDVAAHALVAGNPARAVGYACTCGLRLDGEGEGFVCSCGRRFRIDGDELVCLA